MCGILGRLSPGAHPDLRTQLQLLAHRGPDDEGCHADPDVFLGARRLSIIDIAGGRQPMSNEDGTVWVVQNGEIYNYRDLRARLEALGHVFRTRSDTEVIVHGYEQWGAGCAAHLRGIFAFAVWDQPRRRLLLARDRFGVKPLYYLREATGDLAFASEIRPLLRLLPGTPQADLTSLRDLFTVGYVPWPRTAFRGVHKLPAAHTLVAEDGRVRLDKYWDVPLAAAPHPGEPRGEREAAERFRASLQRAVTEQRMSEVPLGSLISGGLDSSAIAALLQAQSAERVHTFNIGFEEPRYDETPHAERAARHVGTRHHPVRFRAADFDRYPEVMRHLEEPQCSATALPIYLLYEACRSAGLTVILTGEGADELLGGYHWFQGDARVRRLLSLPAAARRLIAASPLPMSAEARRVLERGDRDVIGRYLQWHQVSDADSVLSPELRPADQLADAWRSVFGAQLAGHLAFEQFRYLEAHTRLVDFINFEVDRMSMAHGIEARVPFLDHELWELVARLPAPWPRNAARPKWLLRAAVRDLLPAQTVRRRKWGLAAPYAAWLRRPRLPDWAEDALSPTKLKRAGYFEAQRVARLRLEHQAGRGRHARVLMGVLSTQVWHAQFISGL